MGNIIEYIPRGTVSNSFVDFGSGGGGVEDILRRLGNVETQVGAISAVMPHLATKADLEAMKADIAVIPYLATKADLAELRAELAIIPHLATKADVAAVHLAMKADVAEVKTDVVAVKADVAAVETRIIKWIIATMLASIGTTLASATLAFTIAKFVH